MGVTDDDTKVSRMPLFHTAVSAIAVLGARTPRPAEDPIRWFAVEEYPATGSRKIQKFRLRQDWQEGRHVEL